ncbi:MAG: hypothetical protein ACRDXC_06260 [Acidimicrobiales bacterium]
MTSKDIKDELVEDLEATDEEAESVKGGVMFHPNHPNHPNRFNHHG